MDNKTKQKRHISSKESIANQGELMNFIIKCPELNLETDNENIFGLAMIELIPYYLGKMKLGKITIETKEPKRQEA
jgi:hypothetical protein